MERLYLARSTSRSTWVVAAIFIFACGVASNAEATPAPSLVEAFHTASTQWIGPLQQAATWLLIALATISLVWKFGLLILQNADFQEFVVELIRMVLFVGFFLALIQNAGPWSTALIEGFAGLANLAAGSSGGINAADISPTLILERGGDLSVAIYNSATGWASVFVYSLLSIPIVLLYGLIAAFVLLVFCETYFVTAAGVILLGFGGNPWTNDYAMRYITYCISVGMKLFATLLIVGLGEQLIYGWALGTSNWGAIGNVFSLISVLLLLVVLVWMLPNIVQGVVNGSSLNSGAGSFMAVAAGAGAVAAGTAAGASAIAKQVASSFAAVRDAMKLANTQISGRTASGGLTASNLGAYAAPGLKTAEKIGQTAKNLSQGALKSMGQGIRSESKLAQMVHAAKVEAEKQASLDEKPGGGPLDSLGSAASSISGDAASSALGSTDPHWGDSPLSAYQAEITAMAAEDQLSPAPMDLHRAEMAAMAAEDLDGK